MSVGVESGYACPHGKKVTALSPCDECRPEDFDLEAEDTSENPQAIADAAWCRSVRDQITAAATALLEERDEAGKRNRSGYATVAKLLDTALKFHRCAVEERQEKDDKDHDRWLVEKNRELQQRSNAH